MAKQSTIEAACQAEFAGAEPEVIKISKIWNTGPGPNDQMMVEITRYSDSFTREQEDELPF